MVQNEIVDILFMSCFLKSKSRQEFFTFFLLVLMECLSFTALQWFHIKLCGIGLILVVEIHCVLEHCCRHAPDPPVAGDLFWCSLWAAGVYDKQNCTSTVA